MVITLKIKNYTLLLTVADNGWCKVCLDTGLEKINLGADSFNIFTTRIKDFFESLPNREFSWEIEGVSVWHVTSLSENHFSIYGGVKDNLFYLFFQSADKDIVNRIILTDKERNDFLTDIKNCIYNMHIESDIKKVPPMYIPPWCQN